MLRHAESQLMDIHVIAHLGILMQGHQVDEVIARTQCLHILRVGLLAV